MQCPSDPDYRWEYLYFPSLVAKALSEGAGEVLVFGFLSLVCFQDTFPVACPFRVYLQAQAPFCTSCTCTRALIVILSSPRTTELLVRHLIFWRESWRTQVGLWSCIIIPIERPAVFQNGYLLEHLVHFHRIWPQPQLIPHQLFCLLIAR